MAWSSKHLQEFNNVKVNINSGDGAVSVNLTPGRCNNSWKPATLHMTICLGAAFEEDDWRWHGTRLEKIRWTTFQIHWSWNAAGRKIWKFLDQVITPCHMGCTKPHEDLTIENLAESTPRTYITCPQLSLQKTVANQMKFRGMSAKLHHMNFEKGLNDQVIITMQKTTQNPYMAWATLKIEQTWEKQEFTGGIL